MNTNKTALINWRHSATPMIAVMSFTLILTLVFPLNTYALMPVVDWTAILKLEKELTQMKKQYDLSKQSYDQATQQLTQMQQIRNDSEGHYGYGNLLNSNNELQSREWSPSDWKSALNGLSGGNPARYKQLAAAYKKQNPTMAKKEFIKGASKKQAERYQQEVKVNRAVSVQATYSFNEIKKHLETIKKLSDNIEQTKNTKAALDLNSRLIAEVAYIATQELKMQTILVQSQASVNAERLAGEAEGARINTLTIK